MPARKARSPRGLGLTAALFALSLGAYFPIWLAGAWAELRGPRRDGGIGPAGVAAMALVPVLNIAGLVYLAVATPRALRRGPHAGEANTEAISALMIAAVAGGIGLALLLGVSPLLGGYLAFPLELPAALLIQRHLDQSALAPPPGERRARLDRETVGALAIAAVVLAAGGIALAVSGDDDSGTSTSKPAGPAPPAASDVAVSPQAVWETRLEQNSVERLDKRTLKQVGAPIPVGREPLGIVYGFGSVWVANRTSSTVSRIDPVTGRPLGRPLPTGRAPWGLAVGLGSVWVANQVERTVDRIDPSTGRVHHKVGAAGLGPRGIAVGEGAVWVANFDGDSVSRIDSASGRSRQISLGGAAQDVTTGYGSVWVTRPGDGFVSVLDPQGRRRGSPLQVGGTPSSIVAAGGSVWVADSAGGTVIRIEPRRREIVGRPVPFGGRIADITAADGALWVLKEDGTVQRRKIPPP